MTGVRRVPVSSPMAALRQHSDGEENSNGHDSPE